MDPHLRQRLLGACVLVALAVLLVPVLLDGGYRETALNRRDLGPMPADDFPEQAEGPSGAVRAAIDAGLDASAGQSVPAPVADESFNGSAPVPAKSPAPPASQAQPPRAAAAQPAPRALAPGARWAVQIAAFSAKDKADALVKRLQSAGHKAYVVESREEGGTLYRVRAGPLAARADALALRDRLAANPEFRGTLVRE